MQITLPGAVFCGVQVLVIGGFKSTSLVPRAKGKSANEIGVSINITGRVRRVRALVQFKELAQNKCPFLQLSGG